MCELIKDNNLCVDVTHKADGYIVANVIHADDKKYKLRVSTDIYSYVYDIGDGYITVPLQMGDGDYIVQLYCNAHDNKYYVVGFVRLDVTLTDEYLPFLHSNQYVNYDGNLSIQEIAIQLLDIDAIKQYIERNFVYDYIYAITARRESMMPNINRLLSTHMGICQDFASLTVALMRINNIPSRLVIGTANNHYHAWVEYDYDWKLYDPTATITGAVVGNYEKERIY